MRKFKNLFSLFITMFKIGLFTFGGGYAMIAIIEREITEKKKWLSNEDFLDVIAIAESTPGPLAINTSTFVGYKRGGVLGAIFSTLGVVLPSFIIILVISLFFDAFLELKMVSYAFKGIQAAVAFIILSAGIRMFKKLNHSIFNTTLFVLSVAVLLCLTLFAVNFSTIYVILIAGFTGLAFYAISRAKAKKASRTEKISSPDFDADVKADVKEEK